MHDKPCDSILIKYFSPGPDPGVIPVFVVAVPPGTVFLTLKMLSSSPCNRLIEAAIV